MDGEVQDLVNNTIKMRFGWTTEDFQTLAQNIKSIYQMPKPDREAMGKRGREYHFKHFERT